MPVKAGYLFLAGGGAVVIWSGVKGKRATDVFRTLIGGNSPANLPQAYNVSGVVPTATPGANPGSNPTIAFQGGTGPGPNAGPSSGGGNPGQNQMLARAIAIAMGHADWTTGQQWADWVKLWNQESGWQTKAKNRQSGAYGIPQALPASKMASAGGDWLTNPATQIKWGIGYIAGRYGSPSAAWAHEVANNWY